MVQRVHLEIRRNGGQLIRARLVLVVWTCTVHGSHSAAGTSGVFAEIFWREALFENVSFFEGPPATV